MNIPNIVNDDIIKDLTMLVGSNTVYLWLPNGTRIMSVEGFQDDGSSPVGFIHDPQKDAPIITTADNSASGKMILLNLLLASGVLAFRGTPGGKTPRSVRAIWGTLQRTPESTIARKKTSSSRRIGSLSQTSASVCLQAARRRSSSTDWT